ncbi:MAG: Pycsar system effector family protein [Bacteroidota bacterium]
MISSNILAAAEAHVEHLIIYKRVSGYVFHNLKFRKAFIKECKKLLKQANLKENTRKCVILAACFKDISRGIKEGPLTENSIQLLYTFLKPYNFSQEQLKQLKTLLEGQTQKDPEWILANNILHDAEWAFSGKKKFFKKVKLLLLESKNLSDRPIEERLWYKELMESLLHNRFLTPWAIDWYTKRKNKNLLKLKSYIKNLRSQHKRFKAGKDFGRGIDTAYRITLKNHTDLSRIADGKANMIISINTLILSVLITGLTAGLSMDSFSEGIKLQKYIPIIVLLLSSLLATTFAVFSAVPTINSLKEFSHKDMDKENMLFFGNFLSIEESRFVNYFRGLRTDQEKLYDNLSRDLYGLGKVLRKKYRLLGISYRVFIVGLVGSFLSFLFVQIL